ncbi:cellulose-binding family II protein [Drepanopeziza brunnea f. sp. 'multigermtubi' MB_m1]|uniref:Cellulose-binding family II protein n=1 Tax=Marssonina brunnea f. sp. multigermtubi (strain MB_m1) TaxID=1072389 RepID=K1X697_MARBU|nr:cellulose-binding family II protein [Drepanopeziza brunnea f. sp. 'multigermtubi' MB_m1]EKD16143.1 cellulose-binding family II protein [Drepanopeziza brunnea f. sp. 'multigermtubi' MB_m1]
MKLSIVLLAAGLQTLARASDPRDESAHDIKKRQSEWDPPAEMASALQEVWDHQMKTYNNGDLLGFKNYGFDIIIAAKGTINYCVRWDSDATLSADQRAEILSSLQRNAAKWTDGLTGFMGWPYSSVPIKITGWAAKNADQFTDAASETIYTNIDKGGAPECDPGCGRYFNREDTGYPTCAGGPEARYDMSLWLTSEMDNGIGGAGGDWGQRVGADYFLKTPSPHIWLHEFGHTMGLDDFYDFQPTGQKAFIMLAGSTQEVTEFDIWMMRDFWRHIKAERYPDLQATDNKTQEKNSPTSTTENPTTQPQDPNIPPQYKSTDNPTAPPQELTGGTPENPGEKTGGLNGGSTGDKTGGYTGGLTGGETGEKTGGKTGEKTGGKTGEKTGGGLGGGFGQGYGQGGKTGEKTGGGFGGGDGSMWQQCGGPGFTGSTTCPTPYKLPKQRTKFFVVSPTG